MVSIMMDNGSTDSNTDLECGEDSREILIKENGNSERLKDTEFIHGQTEINTRDSLKNA